MKVFLTGGTGLLGSHLAEGLRAAGHEVVALVRPRSDSRYLGALGCRLAVGDVTDDPSLHRERLEGCQVLIHAAASIYGAPSLEAARWVNVEGTRRLLEGAVEAGVARAIQVSSVAVYGDAPGPLSEETPLDWPLPPWDYYGRSKREGEEVAFRFHREGRLAVTVFRPPAIMGERDRLFIPYLLRWIRGPVILLPGPGRNRLPVVYAGNLVDPFLKVVEGMGGGEVFNLTEDVEVTLRDLLEGLCRQVGKHPRFITVPAGMVRKGAALAEGLGFRIPGARDLKLTRVARLVLEDNPYPARKAKAVLGWAPRFTLDEALARIGKWLRGEKGFA